MIIDSESCSASSSPSKLQYWITMRHGSSSLPIPLVAVVLITWITSALLVPLGRAVLFSKCMPLHLPSTAFWRRLFSCAGRGSNWRYPRIEGHRTALRHQCCFHLAVVFSPPDFQQNTHCIRNPCLEGILVHLTHLLAAWDGFFHTLGRSAVGGSLQCGRSTCCSIASRRPLT